MAESFGADAGRYDRARPSYPAAMVDRIVAASPGPRFLDVGCGTGIAARLFQAAGCTVLGVDVDPRMAEVARHHGLAVEVARFEDWDRAGRCFDAVVAGQTWHWIDPVAGAAKAAAALRPGGLLAVFWNAQQPPPELAAAFAEVYRQVLPESPVFQRAALAADPYASLSARAVDGIRAAGGFAEPAESRFGWDRPYSRDEWLDQVPTSGLHATLPPATTEEIVARIGAVLDRAGGGFTMRYSTVVVTAVRAGQH
jgi:SAM-dependent methyltransferase